VAQYSNSVPSEHEGNLTLDHGNWQKTVKISVEPYSVNVVGLQSEILNPALSNTKEMC
jgi:hypothetical protein